jgi:DNA-binding NarL/FixJ family response regulator
VGDLFLRARVEGLAREAGVGSRFFSTPDALVRELDATAAPPSLVIVDLGDREGRGFALLETFAARRHDGASTRTAPPVLAFYSHVEAATKARALALGATRVVPRSAFVTRFASLVKEITAA